MTHTLIIGAGEIGQALAAVLGEKGAPVTLWDIDPKKVSNSRPLATCAGTADVVLLCVPSWATRAAATPLVPLIRPGTIIVSLAKGIERTTTLLISDVLHELFPDHSTGMLAGPMLAEELIARKGGVGVCASASHTAHQTIATLFSGTTLAVQCTDDVRGVALASVLKNIYAVALGVVDGLAWGYNRKGYVLACAVTEMCAVVVALGGRIDTVLGAAGVGDLLTTGSSVYSRNRSIGHTLATTGTCVIEGEGMTSIAPLLALLRDHAVPTPLLSAIDRMCTYHADAASALADTLPQS